MREVQARLGDLGRLADDAAVAVERAEGRRDLAQERREAVRRARLGGGRHLAGEGQQRLDERLLGRVRQHAQVGLGVQRQRRRRALRAGLGRLALDRRDAGVGVLEVEDGVFLAGLGRQVEVELEVRAGRAHEEEKAHHVRPDLVHQVVERLVGRLPRRHLDRLAAAHERDELVDEHLDPARVAAERLDAAQHVGVGVDVVGPEDVEDEVEAALELVEVVGDVRQAVGRLAGRLDEDRVDALLPLPRGLGLAQRRGLEPRRAVALEGQVAGLELADDLPDGVVLVEVALVELAVHLDAQAPERALDVGEDGVRRRVAERAELVALGERVAPGVAERARDVGDVVAAVAVVGEARRDHQAVVQRLGGRRRVHEGLVAGAHALGQDAHLASGVVVVVLARDGVADPLQERGDGVAQDGVAAVADRQRAGRVGRDELDDGRLAGVRVGAPPGRAGRQDVGEAGREVLAGEADVDKARAGDLDRLDERGVERQSGHERLGDGARRAAERLGEAERHVRGEVAVARVARRLERDLDRRGVEGVGQAVEAGERRAEGGGEGRFHAGGASGPAS